MRGGLAKNKSRRLIAGWDGQDSQRNLCYSRGIVKKPLVQTNPFLRNPAKRRALIQRTVLTSTAIEGIHLTEADLQQPKTKITPRKAAQGIAKFA